MPLVNACHNQPPATETAPRVGESKPGVACVVHVRMRRDATITRSSSGDALSPPVGPFAGEWAGHINRCGRTLLFHVPTAKEASHRAGRRLRCKRCGMRLEHPRSSKPLTCIPARHWLSCYLCTCHMQEHTVVWHRHIFLLDVRERHNWLEVQPHLQACCVHLGVSHVHTRYAAHI